MNITLYHVKYPSGHSFSISGALGILHGTPTVLRDDGMAIFLDPRGVVISDGALVYHPRNYLATMDPALASWMREHPEWAAL